MGWRDHAGTVAAVDAGLLYVFHDGADHRVAEAVANGVHVDLGGVLQEAVHQHRALGRQPALDAQAAEVAHFGHGPDHLGVVVDDLHGPTTQHVGRADQHRVLHLGSDDQGPVGVHRRTARGLGDAQVAAQGVPLLAILGQVDRRRASPGDQLRGQCGGQLQRGLAAQRDDDAHRLLGIDDVGHVLRGERLEVEAVTGVVVGRHGLRVAVDHDGLEAGLPQSKAGVYAAVVKLNALADPVGARPQDHHLGPVGRPDLVLVLPGRVVVRRFGSELRCAGVDRLVGGAHPGRLAG